MTRVRLDSLQVGQCFGVGTRPVWRVVSVATVYTNAQNQPVPPHTEVLHDFWDFPTKMEIA